MITASYTSVSHLHFLFYADSWKFWILVGCQEAEDIEQCILNKVLKRNVCEEKYLLTYFLFITVISILMASHKRNIVLI